VSEGVIDLLEAIEIDEMHGKEANDAKHALMRMEAAWRTLANEQDILNCKRWKKPAG
jgi:hypothetical protein